MCSLIKALMADRSTEQLSPCVLISDGLTSVGFGSVEHSLSKKTDTSLINNKPRGMKALRSLLLELKSYCRLSIRTSMQVIQKYFLLLRGHASSKLLERMSSSEA